MNFLLILLLLLAYSSEVFADALVRPIRVDSGREVLADGLLLNKLGELPHV